MIAEACTPLFKSVKQIPYQITEGMVDDLAERLNIESDAEKLREHVPLLVAVLPHCARSRKTQAKATHLGL